MQLRADDHLAIGRARIEAIIVLVIAFGRVEGRRLCDLGHNRVGKVFLRGGFGGLGHCTLRLVMIENSRSIVGAPIRALLVQRRRIMRAPEPVEECFVADHRWVEVDLGHLRVPRRSSADFPVAGMIHLPAHVTGLHGVDPFELFKDRFDAPETAGAKSSDGERGIDWLSHEAQP